VDKRVRSTSFNQCRQCSIVPGSDRTDHTVVLLYDARLQPTVVKPVPVRAECVWFKASGAARRGAFHRIRTMHAWSTWNGMDRIPPLPVSHSYRIKSLIHNIQSDLQPTPRPVPQHGSSTSSSAYYTDIPDSKNGHLPSTALSPILTRFMTLAPPSPVIVSTLSSLYLLPYFAAGKCPIQCMRGQMSDGELF